MQKKFALMFTSSPLAFGVALERGEMDVLCQMAHEVCGYISAVTGGYYSAGGRISVDPVPNEMAFNITHGSKSTKIPYWIGCNYFIVHRDRTLERVNENTLHNKTVWVGAAAERAALMEALS